MHLRQRQPAVVCPLSLAWVFRLSSARVSPIVVRNGATLSAQQVGRIQEGDVVNVESGPVCADGYNWYLVRNANVAGWTVEGGDGEYWLLPHSG